MSADKSRLKADVLRRAPFVDAIVLVERTGRSRYPLPPVDALRSPLVVAVVDACVSFVAFQSRGTTDAELVRYFADELDATFDACATLHTVVLAFDKYCYVPARKSAARAKRDAASSASRSTAAEWRWDGVSPIVAPDRPLPPWSRLCAERAARAHAMHELGALLARHYTPPAGRRVIIDSSPHVERARAPAHAVPRVVERLADGRRLDAYDAPSLANAIGEGDFSTLAYARRARHDGITLGAWPPSGVCAPPTSTQSLPLAPPTYAAGSVVVHTVDTDLLVLGLLTTLDDACDARHTLWVGMASAVHLHPTSPSYVAASFDGARRRLEVYDVAALADGALRVHSGAALDDPRLAPRDAGAIATAAECAQPKVVASSSSTTSSLHIALYDEPAVPRKRGPRYTPPDTPAKRVRATTTTTTTADDADTSSFELEGVATTTTTPRADDDAPTTCAFDSFDALRASPVERARASASFVAMCVATGNDYVERARSTNHRAFVRALADFARVPASECETDASLHSDGRATVERYSAERPFDSLATFGAGDDDSAWRAAAAARTRDWARHARVRVVYDDFVELYRLAYRRSIEARRGRAGGALAYSASWDALRLAIEGPRSRNKARVATDDELRAMHAALSWYLEYALDATYAWRE